MTEAARIQVLKEFDLEIIHQCRALDQLVYSEKYQSTLEWELPQIKKNPRSRVVAWHGDELIGYAEYIPLTVAAFDKFLTTRDTVFDLLLEEEFISPWIKGTPVDIYLASMVARPDYQSKGISLVLLRGLLVALRELKAEGYVLGRMGGTGVSVAGVHVGETLLGIGYSHDVAGGVATLGAADDVVNYLTDYLGWWE